MKRARAGFTLIEILLTTTLLSVVLGSALMVTLSGSRLYEVTMKKSDAQTSARRALSRVVSELAFAGQLVPDPVAGTDSLVFRRIENVVAGAAVWGNQERLWLQPDPTDPDDGVDNNGNGVVDEGRLVLVRDFATANAQSIVLCDNVRELYEGELANGVDDNANLTADESGFYVQRTAGLLTVRVCIEEASRNGETVITSAMTSISMRN